MSLVALTMSPIIALAHHREGRMKEKHVLSQTGFRSISELSAAVIKAYDEQGAARELQLMSPEEHEMEELRPEIWERWGAFLAEFYRAEDHALMEAQFARVI